MSDPTLQNLQSLIADIICADAHDIHLHATFAELGIDSLDHAQLVNECEDHFAVEISDADAVAASTVAALYDLITRAQGASIEDWAGTTFTPVGGDRSLKNHPRPGPRKTSGRIAVGRTLAILLNPAVQQALAPFWQTDDMRRQLGHLEHHHSELLKSELKAAAKARHPLRQSPGPAAAPSPDSSSESNPSAHSTTPA